MGFISFSTLGDWSSWETTSFFEFSSSHDHLKFSTVFNRKKNVSPLFRAVS